MTTTANKTVTTAADRATVPPAHYTCRVCEPDDGHRPVLALCGAELLGIPAPDDAPACDTCTRDFLNHALSHFKEPA